MALVNYLGVEYYVNGSGGSSYIIHITTTDNVLYGNTITITKDENVIGTVVFDNTGVADFNVEELGIYTVSTTYEGQTFSNTVDVVPYNVNTLLNIIPDGKTITPTDDIQIWLNCANIWDKEYTTLAEVLEDETVLLALMSNNNAVDYMVRSKTFIDGTLDKTTFDGVQRILNAGLESELLEIGDTITVTLTTGEEVDFQVGAINHSGEADHSVIWVAKNCLANARQMNSKNTNVGGWNSSALRTWLNGTFYNQLPEGVKEYVADRVTKASAGNQSTNITNSTDKIFLPREYEIFGATTYAAATEATMGGAKQFPIFAVPANRIKALGRDGASPAHWWESSPVVKDDVHSCNVLTSGGPNSGASIAAMGVVPCFCQSAGVFTNKGIPNNSTAMTDIGANNYCADTLLADEDWLNAICNSEYMESVLNVKVPTMTSNTTPSGEVFGYDMFGSDSTYEYWHVFDNNLNTAWYSKNYESQVGKYVGYKFTTPKVVKRVNFAYVNKQYITTFKIQACNNVANWVDLTDDISLSIVDSMTVRYKDITLNNSNEYQYYRFYITNGGNASGNVYGIMMYELQLYGREDV